MSNRGRRWYRRRRTRRPAKPMTDSKHLYNVLGGIRKRCGLSEEDVAAIKAWLMGAKELNAIVCEYCRQSIPFVECSIDHATPLSRKGDSSLANLALCCKSCNRAKGDMNSEEFVRLLSLLHYFEDRGESLLRRLRAAGGMFRRRGHR